MRQVRCSIWVREGLSDEFRDRPETAASELGVELRAAEDAERDDVEPEEQGDACAERAVDLGVVGKAGDVPAEDEGARNHMTVATTAPGRVALPGLLHGRAHVVDERDEADAAGERDDPADDEGEDVDEGRAEGATCRASQTMMKWPKTTRMLATTKGMQRERDEEEGAAAASARRSSSRREVVGAAKAFHEGGDDAGGTGEADDEGDD